MEAQILTFYIEDQLLAIEANQIADLINVYEYTKIPLANDNIFGIRASRDRIVTLCNLTSFVLPNKLNDFLSPLFVIVTTEMGYFGINVTKVDKTINFISPKKKENNAGFSVSNQAFIYGKNTGYTLDMAKLISKLQ